VASAEQLVSLASSDDVDGKARSDAAVLLAAVREGSSAASAESERRARDETMLAQLELARIPADDDVRKITVKELRRLDAAYAQAFATYLGDTAILTSSTEVALASFRAGRIGVELAGALDHWGLVRDSLRAEPDAPDAAGTVRIRELAAALDGDPWRTRLRALLPSAATEAAQLRELAEQADFATLTAVGCRVLSQALWAAHEKDAAMTVLRRGLEQHPQDFDLCFQLGLDLELLDEPRTREALEVYRTAHAIRPQQNEVLHRQVLAQEVLGGHGDAERLCRILVAREPGSSHWLFHLGTALGRQARFDEAIAVCRQGIALDPGNARLHLNLGAYLERRGKLADAIASLRQAIALDAQDANAHANLGIALRSDGKVDEAIASLRTAIALDPDCVAAHAALGEALFRLGQLDEATASFRKAIELDPNNAGRRIQLGVVLHAQGRLDEAIAAFRKGIELDPHDAEARSDLGAALEAHGQLEEAIASYREAIVQNPEGADAQRRLGHALAQQGSLGEATLHYRRALELAPRDATAYDGLGIALRKLGDPDAALDCFRHVLDLDPLHAPATLNLGACYADKGDFARALVQFQRAEELFGRDSSPFGRGWVEQSRRFIAMAQRMLERPSEVLAGRAAGSSAEWHAAIHFGHDQRRDREVMDLTEATLRDAPQFVAGGDGTYTSACSALLLATNPDAQVTDADRARARALARAWLAREVERASANDADGRELSRRMLADADLASVRGAAIDALPEAERAAWRELWSRIRQLPR
jgi:superkiller protein 3